MEVRVDHGPDHDINPNGYIVFEKLPDGRVHIRDYLPTGELRDETFTTIAEMFRERAIRQELRQLDELDASIGGNGSSN